MGKSMRWTAVLCASALGCSANIGGAPGPSPTPTPTPSPTTSPSPTPSPSPSLVCTASLAVGRTPIHRLTRFEYDSTVRDLLGDDSHPAGAFPADPSQAGFDNVSDVQTVALLHAEKYEAAASALAEALWWRELDPGLQKRWEAELRSETPGPELLLQACCGENRYNNITANGARGLYTGYRVYTLTALDHPGDYTIQARVWLENVDTATLSARPLRLQLLYNEQPIATVPLHATAEAPELVTGTVHVEAAGIERIDVQLDDPTRYSDPPELPRVWVDWMSIQRASTRSPAPPLVRRCELEATGCLRTTLSELARRAYRRPAEAEEIDRLLALHADAIAAGDPEKEAFSEVVSAILLSPHFLYRVELDPDLESTAAHPLSAHELAARLSYFLWGSMPDQDLMAKADDASILEPPVLQSEAERLLASPKNAPMVANLGRQWLSTQALATVAPSPEFFPSFDAALLQAMKDETELFFGAVFREDRPAKELITARFSFLNDRLAAHYGLPLPGSSTPVRVELSTQERGGVLGLGSLLALNSTPVRPSQVLRGKWVLSQLLCDDTSPPPFMVPPLSGAPGRTAREQLEAHSRNPACASCHAKMDPIGFALDGYDADGSRRTRDRQGLPIDESGHFPDGARVNGLAELRTYLSTRDNLGRCLAQHLLVYGLARAPSHDDKCQAQRVAERESSEVSMRQLVLGIVQSEAFVRRQAEGVR